MQILITILKFLVLLVLLLATLGGGACFVFGLIDFSADGGAVAGIGGVVMLLFGAAAWQLLKTFRRQPESPPEDEREES